MENNKKININNSKIKENNNGNKEKTFDKICRLQNLIKKESALKELSKNIFIKWKNKIFF